MKLFSFFLFGCWLLGGQLAHALAACPVLTGVTVTQVTATSVVIHFDALAGDLQTVRGTYAYAGSFHYIQPSKISIYKLSCQLDGLPPATLITVNLYRVCGSGIPEYPTTQSDNTTITFTTSQALPVRQAPVLAALTLSPNPARALTTVQLPLVPGVPTATLCLRDRLGRAVRTDVAPLGTAYPLQLAGLVSGLYTLQVRAGEAWATRRLVVE